MSDTDETNRATRGAIIMCGGGSRRMRRDKASLPFGDETMLARVMRLVSEAVPREQIVVAAAAEQALPPLPWEAIVVRDMDADRGPLPALTDGLKELPANISAVFVTACDAPLLESAFVEALFTALEPGIDAATPSDGERLYPLTAVYRPSCVVTLQATLDEGESSLHRALRSPRIQLRELPLEQLRSVDAELRSLVNCNTPEDYQAALALLSDDGGGF